MLERLQLSGVDIEERAIIEMKKIATVWKKADKKKNEGNDVNEGNNDDIEKGGSEWVDEGKHGKAV